VHTKVRNKNDPSILLAVEKSVFNVEISPVPVTTHKASKINPPNAMNMPVGKRIARSSPVARTGLENNEPIAQEIELIISKPTPIQLDSSVSKVGSTRMISPMNPAVMPAMLNLVGFLPRNNNMNIATQIGMVELIRAAAPEDKY
jgi:hypothetical protein